MPWLLDCMMFSNQSGSGGMVPARNDSMNEGASSFSIQAELSERRAPGAMMYPPDPRTLMPFPFSARGFRNEGLRLDLVERIEAPFAIECEINGSGSRSAKRA